MSALHRMKKVLGVGLGSAAMVLAGCASIYPGRTVSVTLSGSEEVPPVTSSGAASGVISVGTDYGVSGTFTVSGIQPFAAHIHVGAPGENGPVIIGLVKTADNVWSVPEDAALNLAQYTAFYSGGLYVNFHTEANKGGEIRGQLKP